MSYNCHGLKSSVQDIYELCSSYDIVFLQETWLLKDELHMLSTLHPECEGYGISSVDHEKGILAGRPYGGIGILWKKQIAPCVKICNLDDPRLLSIEITFDDNKLCFINVYMPYQ